MKRVLLVTIILSFVSLNSLAEDNNPFSYDNIVAAFKKEFTKKEKNGSGKKPVSLGKNSEGVEQFQIDVPEPQPVPERTVDGTGRVGSATVGSDEPLSGGIKGNPECLQKLKSFKVSDSNSSFKNISYANGKVRIESYTNEPLEINCEQPSSVGTTAQQNWSPVQQESKKPGAMDYVFPVPYIVKQAFVPMVYNITNKHETPVQSIVSVLSFKDGKTPTLIELSYREWGDKKIRIICPKKGQGGFGVFVKDKKVQNGYKIDRPEETGPPKYIPPPEPIVKEEVVNCPPEYFSLDVAGTSIKAETPATASSKSNNNGRSAGQKGVRE